MGKRKILIADKDQKLIVQLKDALVPMGYEISTAIDGAIALQKVLSNPPGLILMDINLKIISGAKIAQILRANPRTSDIPFFFLSSAPASVDAFIKFKDVYILKPIDYGKIILKIESYFKGIEKATEVADQDKEISGHLSQISLVDLLQVFNMNKKSGQLVIRYKDENGIIYIKDGNVINAELGKIEGEKAFYRLMMLREERFNFLPEGFLVSGGTSVPKITKKTDNLLMEGLRQIDEWQRMRDNLPHLSTTVKLKVDPGTLTKGIQPVTQEIFILMEFYNKVGDIVNNSSFSDYEVLKTLYTLLQKRIIEETSSVVKRVEKAFLLTPEQLVKIKKRLMKTKGFRLDKKYGKILIVTENFEILKKIIHTFSLLKEFSINQRNLSSHRKTSTSGSSDNMDFIGIIGTLKLTEGMSILFYSVPAFDKFKPLWNAFSQDVIDVLLLMPYSNSKYSSEIKDAYSFFNDSLKKTVKPILITENQVSDNELDKIKEDYEIDKIYNYNTEDKEKIKDLFVNLLIEML